MSKHKQLNSKNPFAYTKKKKSLLQDILPSLEAAAQARRPLVIIAEYVDGEAPAACILVVSIKLSWPKPQESVTTAHLYLTTWRS
jgi:hypothetical protein